MAPAKPYGLSPYWTVLTHGVSYCRLMALQAGSIAYENRLYVMSEAIIMNRKANLSRKSGLRPAWRQPRRAAKST